MLHYYRFKNFQSFRGEVEVSLLLNNRSSGSEWEARSKSGARLNAVMAIFGANGAGKTAALKPLVFAEWFMGGSFSRRPEADIPLIPHFTSADEPTEIELVAEDIEGVVWRYVLHATRKRVVHEALYRKSVGFKYVFVRDWNDAAGSYDIKQSKFGLKPGVARKVRQNASLISTAVQYEIETAYRAMMAFLTVSNVNFQGRSHFDHGMLPAAARQLNEDEFLKRSVINLLVSWDVGLTDIVFEEIEVIDEGVPEKVLMPFGLHRGRDGEIYKLPMYEESSGTQSAFVLLPLLFMALSSGSVAVVDELENDLHPHMIEPILSLFANQKTNKTGAQLIFTCHSSEVLNLLQKAQILFVEKVDCESDLYRADSIQGLRPDDNLRAKYLAGALGAVPQI